MVAYPTFRDAGGIAGWIDQLKQYIDEAGAGGGISVFNPMLYGAVGGDLTLDTAGWQAALDAADAAGGIVFAPDADYLVNTLNYRNQLVVGASERSTRLIGQPGQDVLHADPSLSWSSRSFGGLRDLTIVVDDSVDASASFPQRGGVGNACLSYDFPNGAVAQPLRLSNMKFENVIFQGLAEDMGGNNKSAGIYCQPGGHNTQLINVRFMRLEHGWWQHYPTSNLGSALIAFDHCSWEDTYFNGCRHSARWINIGYSRFSNLVSHGTANAFIWEGVADSGYGICHGVSVDTLMTEFAGGVVEAGSAATFINCERFEFTNAQFSNEHADELVLSLDNSVFRGVTFVDMGSNTAPVVRITGDHNTIEDLSVQNEGSLPYVWDIVDDQGHGNKVLAISLWGGAASRNRIRFSGTRDPRILHVRDSGSFLQGYYDPPFVSANDLLVSPDVIRPGGSTEGDLVNGHRYIADTTADLGRALEKYGGGGFNTTQIYNLNGENGAIVGEFLPKGKIRVYAKVKAAVGGTQTWHIRTGAGNTDRGSGALTLTTSYTVQYFDVDLTGATLGDVVNLDIGSIGGGGDVPVTIAWIMFRPFTNDLVNQIEFPDGSVIAGSTDINARAYGATGDGVTDDTAAIQAALDAADAAEAADLRNPNVFFPPGVYCLTSTLSWAAGNLIGSFVGSGVQIIWNGSAGGTMLSRTSGASGDNSFFLIDGIEWSHGSADPATVIDFTAMTAGMDKFGIISRCMFAGTTGDAIKLLSFINLHWTDLRFDSIGGYCIKSTLNGSEDGMSFCVDRFTYSNNAVGVGKGFLLIDNTANAANLGVVSITNGRTEMNQAWASGPKGLVVHKLPNASPATQSLKLHVDNVTVIDSSGQTGNCILYRDTTDTNTVDVLMLSNVIIEGVASLVGGGWSSNWGKGPNQTYYGTLVVGAGDTPFMSSGIMRLNPNAVGGAVALEMFKGQETQPRVRLGNDGILWLGDGSSAPDVDLQRETALLLGTEVMFRASAGLTTKAKAGAVSDGDFIRTPDNATIAIDTINHRLYFKSGGGVWKYVQGV